MTTQVCSLFTPKAGKCITVCHNLQVIWGKKSVWFQRVVCEFQDADLLSSVGSIFSFTCCIIGASAAPGKRQSHHLPTNALSAHDQRQRFLQLKAKMPNLAAASPRCLLATALKGFAWHCQCSLVFNRNTKFTVIARLFDLFSSFSFTFLAPSCYARQHTKYPYTQRFNTEALLLYSKLPFLRPGDMISSLSPATYPEL